MKNFLFWLLAAGFLYLTACGGGAPKSAYDGEKDLKEYGIPIKIKSPKEVKVTSSESIGLQNTKVEGKDFYIDIWSSDAVSSDRKAAKAEVLKEVQSETGYCKFKKLVTEEDFGFIYEKTCEKDTVTKLYDFRYVFLQGTKIHTFKTTTTFIPPFTEAQVKDMYQAVKQEVAAK